MGTFLYRAFSYFGLASIFGAFLYGFRYDPAAPAINYLWNLVIYGAWVAVHLGMTHSRFKAMVYGSPSGTLRERQVFITVTVVTWLAVLAFHPPVPGVSLELPGWVAFVGTVGIVLSVMAFFEGVTFANLDSLLGVPGSALSHSQGAETPLLTEGQYASVRHPMYRAALAGGLCSLLIHPHAGQVLWGALIGGTFLGFIPIEERQLIAARGEAYEGYMARVQWRVMRGVW